MGNWIDRLQGVWGLGIASVLLLLVLFVLWQLWKAYSRVREFFTDSRVEHDGSGDDPGYGDVGWNDGPGFDTSFPALDVPQTHGSNNNRT